MELDVLSQPRLRGSTSGVTAALTRRARAGQVVGGDALGFSKKKKINNHRSNFKALSPSTLSFQSFLNSCMNWTPLEGRRPQAPCWAPQASL